MQFGLRAPRRERGPVDRFLSVLKSRAEINVLTVAGPAWVIRAHTGQRSPLMALEAVEFKAISVIGSRSDPSAIGPPSLVETQTGVWQRFNVAGGQIDDLRDVLVQNRLIEAIEQLCAVGRPCRRNVSGTILQWVGGYRFASADGYQPGAHFPAGRLRGFCTQSTIGH